MYATLSKMPIAQFSQPGVAIVVDAIQPQAKGWVKFDGTQWSAQFYNSTSQKTIAPGERVQVLGRQGNTLLVVAENQEALYPSAPNDRPGWLGRIFGE